MEARRRLAFGDVAELYDAARPSYPAALVDDVLDYAGAPDRALEVGAGTGRATLLFAGRGLKIHALEPSPEMAAIARRRCSGLGHVEIEGTDFESFALGGGRFDLLFCAQAWHWVSPEVRYVKARELLKRGGALALFWNRPRWQESPVRDDLREAYRELAPDFGDAPGPMHPDTEVEPDLWGAWAEELSSSPGFAGAEMRSYEHTVEYTADGYLRLLATHSDHILLGEVRRAALFAAVREVLDRHGGAMTVRYGTVLSLARAR